MELDGSASATRTEGVLEAEEVEQRQRTIAVAVGSGVARGEGVLERQEVENGQGTITVHAWRDLNDRAGKIEPGQPWRCGSASVFIDKVDARLPPPMPLDTLSRERSAAGRIASLILELQSDGAGELVAHTGTQFSNLSNDRNLRVPDIGEDTLPAPDPRTVLEHEARAILGELLAQCPTEAR